MKRVACRRRTVRTASLAGRSLSALLVDRQAAVPSGVYAVAAGTLIVLAIVSLFTGFRIAFLPFRLCPFIFTAAAVLIAWGAWG